ncbi:MAG: MFS transporter [Burkholderiaceae bacterium]
MATGDVDERPVPDASGRGLLPATAALRVFSCLAAAYLLSYALRAINAAIAPELVAEFGLSNAELGSLSSAYFLAFAAMQLPLGVWLDRFGTRRTNATLLLLAALGSFVFSQAPDATWLWIGRGLIGAGLAGALMSSLRVFRFWYPADRQQQLLAMMLVVGSIGALLATAPSRLLLPIIGWRGLFVVTGVGLILASAAIFAFLPRHEPESARARADAGGKGFAGYLHFYGHPYFWRFALLALTLHASFVAFQSLWAGPWLTQVLGMTPAAAGQALFALNLVLMLSFLALGVTVRWLTARGISIVQMCIVSSLVIIALHVWLSFNQSPLTGVVIWLCYALISTPYTLLQSHVSLSFPESMTGRAFTAYNLFLFGGVFLVQWVFGVLIDWCSTFAATEAIAYRYALRIWIGLELLGLAWMLVFRVGPPKPAAHSAS